MCKYSIASAKRIKSSPAVAVKGPSVRRYLERPFSMLTMATTDVEMLAVP